MAQRKTEDFETLWKQSIRLPAHKEISVAKIKVDLSITEVMDRFLEFSKQAVAERKMKKEVYEALAEETTRYKRAFSKVNKSVVRQLLRQRIRRRLGIGR